MDNNAGEQKNNSGCGCGCLTFIIILVLIAAVPRVVTRYKNRHEETGTTEVRTTEMTTEMTTSGVSDYDVETQTENKITNVSSDENVEDDVSLIDEYNLYGYTGYGLEEDNPATNICDVQETVLYLAMHDVPSPVKIYVSGLSEMDCKYINNDFDNTFIKVYQYSCHSDAATGEIRSVDYSFNKMDSFYVYKNIVEGIEIPAEEENALAVQSVVSDFMSENIDSSMSEYDRELAIHDYLVEITEFGNEDEVIESEHDVYGVFVDHVAVCEGYAKAFELLSYCCGIESRLINGYGDDNSHVWNLTKINDIWYQVDVTWDDPTKTEEDYDEHDFGITHAYFNITDEYMSNLKHSWNSENYPECTSLDANYYVVNDSITDHDGFVSLVNQYAVNGNTIDVAVSDFQNDIYNIDDIVRSTGYVGGWFWSMCFDLDVTGYQVIRLYFY